MMIRCKGLIAGDLLSVPKRKEDGKKESVKIAFRG